MNSQQLTAKINNLKEVLKNFSTDVPLVGISLVKRGEGHSSSDNWLFNTNVKLDSILVPVLEALQAEIDELESQLPALQQAEADQKAIEDAQKAQEEADRLAQEQAEAEAKKIADFNALILKQKEILLAQDEARKLIDAEKEEPIEPLSK